jgi:formylglycine-generating enzyme required for sulfatase activity
VTVGDAGNACEPRPGGCFGAVADVYRIAKYEVTNAQYVEFLNAKAASDPLQLYSTNMGFGFGGITRSGTSGSYLYSAIADRENMPVNYVSFYSALRFANWLHNGQGSGDTETGAYALLGGTAEPSNGHTVTRNPEANIFLPSENEWYKAAYHNALGLGPTDYFDYPAGSDTQTTCGSPTSAANHGNCNGAVGDFTSVGSYTGSPSPHGTFDQGGNTFEWNEEATLGGAFRGLRGGSFAFDPILLGAASGDGAAEPWGGDDQLGFRLASVPEPAAGLLVLIGLLGSVGWRRRRVGAAVRPAAESRLAALR